MYMGYTLEVETLWKMPDPDTDPEDHADYFQPLGIEWPHVDEFLRHTENEDIPIEHPQMTSTDLLTSAADGICDPGGHFHDQFPGESGIFDPALMELPIAPKFSSASHITQLPPEQPISKQRASSSPSILKYPQENKHGSSTLSTDHHEAVTDSLPGGWQSAFLKFNPHSDSFRQCVAKGGIVGLDGTSLDKGPLKRERDTVKCNPSVPKQEFWFRLELDLDEEKKEDVLSMRTKKVKEAVEPKLKKQKRNKSYSKTGSGKNKDEMEDEIDDAERDEEKDENDQNDQKKAKESPRQFAERVFRLFTQRHILLKLEILNLLFGSDNQQPSWRNAADTNRYPKIQIREVKAGKYEFLAQTTKGIDPQKDDPNAHFNENLYRLRYLPVFEKTLSQIPDDFIENFYNDYSIKRVENRYFLLKRGFAGAFAVVLATNVLGTDDLSELEEIKKTKMEGTVAAKERKEAMRKELKDLKFNHDHAKLFISNLYRVTGDIVYPGAKESANRSLEKLLEAESAVQKKVFF